MKAAVASEHGLALRDMPQPQPRPNEVLVKVRAAALNRADLATARGIPHGSHGGIGAAVGLEWAGEGVATRSRGTRRASAACVPAAAAMPHTPSAAGAAATRGRQD